MDAILRLSRIASSVLALRKFRTPSDGRILNYFFKFRPPAVGAVWLAERTRLWPERTCVSSALTVRYSIKGIVSRDEYFS
jgi:hypothetical protein